MAVSVRGADLKPLPTALVDARATTATRRLMADLVADYGTRTWSGQYYDTNDLTVIHTACNLKPAIIGGDLMDYSPSRVARGSKPAGYTESMIALARAGHVITLSWHWNAPTNLLDTKEHPWWRGFYTEASTFDVAAALANTNSPEYAELIRDMDTIAAELKKFSDAGIPVLWRPLHEADGAWFWWGAKGPAPFKTLWRLLYHRLTDHHQLHNLIWVYSGENPDWYPGDDVVDIVGVDEYPKDPNALLLPKWQMLKSRFNGVKLIALTEFGGVPSVAAMQKAGVWWSYFASWPGTKSVPASLITRTYRWPSVVTLDQLPYHLDAESSNHPAIKPGGK